MKKAWTAINWDWKSGPTPEELERALKAFGIRVYEDPMSAGTDSYGFIFSNEELTDEDLAELEERDD